MSEWNPRYVAYASAHGRKPEEQDAADKNGAQYINWINLRIREWRDERGLPRDWPLSVAEHIDLDEWLAARFPAVVREPKQCDLLGEVTP